MVIAEFQKQASQRSKKSLCYSDDLALEITSIILEAVVIFHVIFPWTVGRYAKVTLLEVYVG